MALQTMYPAMINSVETVITNVLSPSDTILYVADETKIPEVPNLLVIGGNLQGAETVKLISKIGNKLTVERGFQGSAKAWQANAVISRNFTAYDHDTFINNIITNNSHIDKSVYTEQGVHNLRFFDERLQFFDGTEWLDISTGGGGIAPKNVTDLSMIIGDEELTIKWGDPTDTVIDGAVVAEWLGTKIVRKAGAYPVDERDGIMIMDNQVRNQFLTNGLVDTGLTNGTVYYYQAFPYTIQNVFNKSASNRISGSPIPIAPTAVTNVSASVGDSTASITFNTPVIDFIGIRLVYKINGFPTGIDDGNVILNYASGTPIENLSNNVEYFFRLFPYNAKGRFQTSTTQQISATPSLVIPDPVTNLVAITGNSQIAITYTNPTSAFSGVRLVWKLDSFPTGINDGTVITNYVSGTPITGLTNSVAHYFRLFSYNVQGAFNTSTTQQISAIPVTYHVFGVRIDTTNSDPEIALTYTDDAVGMIAGSVDWDIFFPYNLIKPCLLLNGVVQTYLNKDNFSLKENGQAADITSGNAGDVMIEIPKCAYMIYTEDIYVYVKITDAPDAKIIDSRFAYYGHTRNSEGDRDNLYIGAYLGYESGGKLWSLSAKKPTVSKTIGSFRTLAKANGAGYDQISFYPITLLQCLYIIRFKNLDSQTVIGRGFVDGNTTSALTGGANTRGMYFGETTGKQQMVFAGIEDFWGNLSCWFEGLFSDASRNILTAFATFNDSASGYYIRGNAGTTNLSGFMSKPQGNNYAGFIMKEGAGSNSTFYCDSGSVNPSVFPVFGGYWAYGSLAGIFYMQIVVPSTLVDPSFGSRLMYL